MRSLTILLFFLLAITSAAQIIPDSLRVNWQLAQEHFRFIEPGEQINITDFGGVGDGITDNSAALESAMASAGDRNTAIYFPPGAFLFNSTITLHDSLSLTGAGSDFTTLLFDFNGQNIHGIKVSGSAGSPFVLLDGGYTKGSNKIFTDSAFLFSSGQMVEITETNGSWDIKPISWAENSVGQMTVIDSVAGDTLFLQSPLNIDYTDTLTPVIRAVNPIVNVAISCLKLKRLDEPPSGGGYNVYFAYAKNCRVKGIESDTSVASHVYITKSLGVRVTGSYFHHAFQYDGASTHGYGVTINHHASECVVENNIFMHLRHAMMVKTGANGNVFGYNYSTDVYRSEPVHDYAGDISLHGHYAFSNLFEGNIAQNIVIDHYWGPAGPFNTFFRNRAELYGIIMTSNNILETSMQNFTGNEVTDNSAFHGKYKLTGTNHFEYGNNVLNQIIPEGTDSLPDKSCYLPEKPPFWNISDGWPSIGLPAALNSGTNPAKERYLSGTKLTVCTDSVITAIPAFKTEVPYIKIFPNPGNGNFYIEISDDQIQTLPVAIYTLTGKKIFYKTFRSEAGKIIKVTAGLPPGIYIVVAGGKTKCSAKVAVYE